MKNNSPSLSGIAKHFVAAIAVAGLLWSGCSKQGSDPGASSGGASTAEVPRGGVKSAEPTSFYEVAKHLDAGGSLYAYLRTSQWLQGLSTNVAAWQEMIGALPSIPAEEKARIGQAFNLATNLIANSGIEEIDGVGLSGIALEPGYYRTKFVVHRNPSAKSGYLWSVAGKAPHPLSELDLLPADTVWAAFGDFSLGAVLDILKKEVRNADIAEAVAGWDQVEAAVQQATGASLPDLLNSLGGQQGILLTLSSTRTVKIPVPTGPAFELPEPAILISIKVKDDQLFNVVDRLVQKVPNVVRTDEADLKARSIPVPFPIGNVKPTIARHGEYIFIASNDEIVRNVIAVKAGKEKGLKSSDEFKRLAKGLPTEGNSFAFIGQRAGDAIRQVQEMFVESAAAQGKDGEEGAALVRRLMQLNSMPVTYSVGSNTKEGWLFATHGNQEPAKAVLMSAVVAPAAIVAAVALPAFAKARQAAQVGQPGRGGPQQQSVACINNLKELGLGCLMWADAHGKRYPSSLLVLTNELKMPRALFCPGDPKSSQAASATWESLNESQISYELASPNLLLTASGASTVTLIRCRVHGNTCMGDGSVKPYAAAAGRR